MKQQQLSVRRKSDRQQSCQYSFLLSGFSDHEKTTLARQIIRLGGKYLDCREFSLDCTHVVCIRPMRSEKFLCGCASGRWVVTPDFIHDSIAAGRWLEETNYVWDNDTSDDSNSSITTASMVNAPKRWREHLVLKNQRAFEGWTVAILVTKAKNRPAVYKRLIECGGGNVLSFRSPAKNLESFAKTLNYIFLDKCFLEKVRPLLAEGVPCLAPDYIAEYLFEEAPDIEKYDIRTYEPNQRNNDSDRNSLSSTAASFTNSPLQGRSVSLVPAAPLIATALKATPHAIKPKRFRQSQLPASLFTQTSSHQSRRSDSQSQSSVSQSPSSGATSKHRSPLTKSPATPSFTQTTLERSPLTRSKTPGGLGAFVKHTARSKNPINVKGETLVNRKLFSSHQVQKTVEEVKKKYSPSYYSRVPYWIQVKPPKYQEKEVVTMPFPTMVCNLIDAYLEEGLWLRAVESIHSYLSVKKYPPSSLLHVIMSKVLEWKDVAFTSQAINLLKSVLCVHRPSTPEMSQVYLQSFVPSDNELFGLESDDPINTPWDFIGSVIRKSLQLPLGDSEEDLEEHEKAPQSVLRNNHQMLLSYIVALVEQDFQVWVHRQVKAETTREQKSCHCMLSSILWPDGNVKASGPFAAQLISFMLEAVAAIGSASHMYPCLRMIISLVEMAAETCRVIAGDSSIMGHAETGVHLDLAAEIASMLSQGGLVENVESLNVLLSLLRPDWLKLKVVESLLCAYDDSLVREDFRELAAEPLSLKKVVNYYFYLLPLLTKAPLSAAPPEKQNQPITNSRKRPHQDVVQAGPLKTLAVRNNISNTQTLRERPKNRVPKLKVNKVNRKNMRGETPLHLACIKNNVAKVRDLLAIPAIEVNQVDFVGWTALHEAANHGHIDCIKELLKYKPKATIASYFTLDKGKKSVNTVDLHAAPAECGTTPLHDAVNNGHVEVARLLVKAGGKAVLMARNKAGCTPLDLAADNAMRHALMLSPKMESETTSPDSDSQKIHPRLPESSPSKHPTDVGIPSEEEYIYVLGSLNGPKMYISAERCEQLCLLVCHLLRACLRAHKLVPIKADLDSQHGSVTGFSGCKETSVAGCGQAHPQASVRYEMMTSLSNEGAFQQSSLRLSGSRLLDDLTEMCRLESHIGGFVHHIGRIGPWVGSQRSKICNKVVNELKALLLTYQ